MKKKVVGSVLADFVVFVYLITLMLVLQGPQSASSQSCNNPESKSQTCGKRLLVYSAGSFVIRREQPGVASAVTNIVECTWKIVSPLPSEVLNVSITNFTLEGGEDCPHDYIEVFDGTKQVRNKTCGTSAPASVISTTTTIIIHFRTDGLFADTGFIIRWSSIKKSHFESGTPELPSYLEATTAPPFDCGGYFEGLLGSFSSPEFPDYYPANLDCFWTIKSLSGYALEITFKNFSLERSGDCDFDFLEILDEYGQTGTCYCGSFLPNRTVLSGNIASIIFHTDAFISGNGFFLEWTSHDIDECSLNSCGTNTECRNTDGSFQCICKKGFAWNGTSCEDMDECEMKPCNAKQNCQNIEGSFLCPCKIGYIETSDLCSDINECFHDPCHENASCSNTEGSYVCTCNNFFKGNGIYCEESVQTTKAMQTAVIASKPSTGVTNTSTSAVSLDTQRTSTDDVNATSIDTTVPEATNIQTRQSFSTNTPRTTLVQTSTVTLTEKETTSLDINICDGITCVTNALCVVTSDGKPTCECENGYKGNGNLSCRAICEASTLEIDGRLFTFDNTLPQQVAYSTEKCQAGFSQASIKCDELNDVESTLAHFAFETLFYINCTQAIISSAISSVNFDEATQAQLDEFLSTLDLMTSFPDYVTNDDVVLVVQVLEDLSKTDGEIKISQTVFEKVINIADHIAGKLSEMVDQTQREDSSARLLNSLTTLGHELTLFDSQSFKFFTSDMAAEVLDTNSVTNTEVPYMPSFYQGQDGDVIQPVSIKIPPEAISQNLEQDFKRRKKRSVENSTNTRLVFFAHRSSQLFPSSYETPWVISADVGNRVISELSDPVVITFHNENRTGGRVVDASGFKATYINQSCVFWNFTLQDWSTQGCCLVEGSNPPQCQCNHLTNFAVLVSVYDMPENVALSIVTKVGCIVSIVSLILTVVLQQVPKHIRSRRPITVVNQICINLAIVYIIFLNGMDKRENVNGCLASAILLHYFLLCVWCWMVVYAHVLYKSLVQVFNISWNGYLTRAAALSYGIPLLIVSVNAGVTLVLSNDPVGSPVCGKEIPNKLDVSLMLAENMCWLHGYSLYFSFLLPVGIILCINIVIFFVVLREIKRSQKLESSIPKRSLKQHLLVAVTMASTLGLVWLIGYFMLLSDNEIYFWIMSWIFSVSATLQGFCIFLLLCVRNREVWEHWKLYPGKVFCCVQCRNFQENKPRRGSKPINTMTTEASKFKVSTTKQSRRAAKSNSSLHSSNSSENGFSFQLKIGKRGKYAVSA
ncbi:unnamed protein product [Clavelina lepadiformis]|uniref:Uncharacterized protein n=1 Tax=Clavelina lepadiformis TaxID=159417 RepID=A0ABP0GGC1_CLALP